MTSLRGAIATAFLTACIVTALARGAESAASAA
jgi:hypothetical protein